VKKWISQKFSGFENLSYVGETTGFRAAKKPVISAEICRIESRG